ncbi:MAG: phosphatase PAP2 family protein [Candidatus Endonucleobacter sp. (ex Gigantidas childressi)]|nr:phosphatase PAP2 family protein [Candidatus Endonucleobacter sp. (ex Gigantidas childressi)]
MPISNNSLNLTLVKRATLFLLPIGIVLWVIPCEKIPFLWLNSRLVEWAGVTFWALLTNLGDGFFLFPLAMLLVKNNPKRQQALIITIILAALVLNAGKYIVDTTRPLGVFGDKLVTVVGPEVKSHSMPSGHAGTIFILAGLTILFANKWVALLVLGLSTLIALSRVAVGAHFLVDVVAGAWIGLVCASVGEMLSKRCEVGFLIRAFFVFLGFIPAFLLPFYDNGFQDIVFVQILQYILAVLSLILSVAELNTLVRDYSAKRKEKT